MEAVTGIISSSGQSLDGDASTAATSGETRRCPEARMQEAENIDGGVVRVRIARAELRFLIRRGENCLAPAGD